MKVLVTGGGGFLGGAIVRMLQARGDEVTVVARGDYPALVAAGVRLHRGDLADAAAVDAAFAGQDVVIHAAAKPGVWGPYEDFHRSNVLATRVVLDACRKHGVSRLVYTSSPSVVFDAGDHQDASNDLPYPGSYLAFYPQTKAEAEREVLAANGPTLATVSLRPHLIWGPGDPNLLPRLIDRARRGRLRIVGDGKNKVSLTYIDNAAVAHLQAADRLAPGVSWAGKAYFVNDPEPVVLWEWINQLLGRLDVPQVKGSISPALARTVGGIAEGV
ncbi:MAG TPA: NAD-dependent epimerase/dehydratase family protein, partial [Myxococcota bacterium]|nr:NAD-dependent epimerase/dehydratase family protein [Myxococcota bacterium]